MIGIILELVYANVMESLIHKYILHGFGKDRNSFWAFHFYDHHKNTIKGGGIDNVYENLGFYSRELWSLLILGAVHLPFWWVSMPFTITLFTYIIVYYTVHTQSHRNVEWAKKWVPWHYDHHMGGREANWGVVLPLFDKVVGSRVYYKGTGRFWDDEIRKSRN